MDSSTRRTALTWVMELRHYRVHGTLDPAFGNAGKADVSAYLQSAVSGIAADSHGRIVVSGTSARPGPGDYGNRGLIRLTPAGALDNSFGIGGRAIDGFEGTFTLESDDD